MANEIDPSSPSQNSPEPRGLLHILASAFSGVLFGLFLSKLNTPSNDPTHRNRESAHPKDNPGPETTRSPLQIPITSQVPPAPAHYYPDSRKDNTPPWKKWTEIVAVGVACGLLIANVIVTIGTWRAANAAKDAADWSGHQARDQFADQRPRIWAAIPDHIHLEAGKPINPQLTIFNYGRGTGIARARIRFEAGPGIIDNFRRTIRANPHYLDIPDEMGTLKAAILPNNGRSFLIETKEVILSREDIKKLIDGTIDVAIYGRIFYTDLALKAEGERISHGNEALYRSLFCFYVMPDGTTSACPNQTAPKEEAFTNWVP